MIWLRREYERFTKAPRGQYCKFGYNFYLIHKIEHKFWTYLEWFQVRLLVLHSHWHSILFQQFYHLLLQNSNFRTSKLIKFGLWYSVWCMIFNNCFFWDWKLCHHLFYYKYRLKLIISLILWLSCKLSTCFL